VDQLDLTPMHAEYGEERRGQPPCDPRTMTKLLVYGYCVGVYSPRKMQQRLREDVAFRILAAGNEPDFRTISDFRKIHLETLSGRAGAGESQSRGQVRGRGEEGPAGG